MAFFNIGRVVDLVDVYCLMYTWAAVYQLWEIIENVKIMG